MNDFSGYTKVLENKLIRIKHQIKVRLNDKAIDIKALLANVPDNAILSMVVDDDEDGIGELEFVEEKNID